MSLAVFASARGAPGATTAAVAVAGWLDDSVLVEADPAGGALAVCYGLGREPGLLTLASNRSGRSELREHAQVLPGGTAVVVAPETPGQVHHLWQIGTRAILDTLRASSDSVLVDVGRFGPASPATPLVEDADVVCVVSRPVAEQLIPAASLVTGLDRAGIVLVGEGPYTSAEVTAQLGVPVLAVLADDRRAADSLVQGGSGRAVTRSALMRSARVLAEVLAMDQRSVEHVPEVTA